MGSAWIQIDATDEARLDSVVRNLFTLAFSPLMYILSNEAADLLDLKIPKHHFQRYEKVVLYLPGICSDYVPTAIDAFNASDFEGVFLLESESK